MSEVRGDASNGTASSTRCGTRPRGTGFGVDIGMGADGDEGGNGRSGRIGCADQTGRRLADTLRGLHRALRLVVLAGAGWAGAGHAQASPDCPPVAAELTPARVEAGMQAARDHGFLWRITKGGHSSFLYGTVHLARLE